MYQSDDKLFEEWQPEPGSRLHAALLAQRAAAAECDALAATVAELQERRERTRAAIRSIDWKADVATAGSYFSELPALEAMIAAAQHDLTAAENELRKATKAVVTDAANLEAARKNVLDFEKLKRDVPGRFTESDERRLKEYRDALAQLSAVYLAA